MDETRWEHALHETKGLGDLRRDAAVLLGVAALMFAGLRLFAPGSVAGTLLYSLLVGFGVLVVLPLFELLWNYRRAPSTPAAPERPEPDQPEPAQRGPEHPDPEQRDREEELRERFRRTI